MHRQPTSSSSSTAATRSTSTPSRRSGPTAEPKYFGKTYQKAPTVFFSNQVNTGCGAADSGTGPFYCPSDNKVYIDLTFYKLLADQLGAPGEFAQPYVLAHEYGHHIQDLVGTEAKMRQLQQGASDARRTCSRSSSSCRPTATPGCGPRARPAPPTSNGQKIFKSLTAEDIQQGIDTAGKIGDDTLQKQAGQQINPAEFTHGTSADRQKWFSRGYNAGTPENCDTFANGAVVRGRLRLADQDRHGPGPGHRGHQHRVPGLGHVEDPARRAAPPPGPAAERRGSCRSRIGRRR